MEKELLIKTHTFEGKTFEVKNGIVIDKLNKECIFQTNHSLTQIVENETIFLRCIHNCNDMYVDFFTSDKNEDYLFWNKPIEKNVEAIKKIQKNLLKNNYYLSSFIQGTGKSFITKKIAFINLEKKLVELPKERISLAYYYFPNLILDIKDSWDVKSSKKNFREKLTNFFETSTILILDNVNSSISEKWVIEVLLAHLIKRKQNQQIFITSNYSKYELQQILSFSKESKQLYDFIISICENNLIQLGGINIREE